MVSVSPELRSESLLSVGGSAFASLLQLELQATVKRPLGFKEAMAALAAVVVMAVLLLAMFELPMIRLLFVVAS